MSDGIDEIAIAVNITVVPAVPYVTSYYVYICSPKSTNITGTRLITSSLLSASCVDTPPSQLVYTLLSVSGTSPVQFELFNGTVWNTVAVNGSWTESDVKAEKLRVTMAKPLSVAKPTSTASVSVSSDAASIKYTMYFSGAFYPVLTMKQPIVYWNEQLSLTSTYLLIEPNDLYNYNRYYVRKVPSLGTISATSFYQCNARALSCLVSFWLPPPPTFF